MEIRLFQPQDAPQIAQLFHDTVRIVNCQDYSLVLVQAWAPDDLYFRDWIKICAGNFTYIAEEQGVILGFAELKADGFIDCFYSHKDFQGCGVGSKLLQAIAQQALELGCDRLYTEASIAARDFFQNRGFVVKQEQQVAVRGEVFKNYRMEKIL